MDTLIHADIFFFVTTVALIVVSAFIVVALIYVILILRDVSKVSKKVQEESSEIIDDLKTLRTSVKQEGIKLPFIGSFLKSLFNKRKKSK